MSASSPAPATFSTACVSELDEPARRYLTHAIADGAVLPAGVRLKMAGRINVGRWLAFTAEQEFRGHQFVWSARAGWRRFRPLHVVDAYRHGAGSTEGRVLGRWRFMRAAGTDTARAAAGRAAAESIWNPASLLPHHGVMWRTTGADEAVATVPVPPEQPDVKIAITEAGALRSVSLLRWGNVGQPHFGYIPFGGSIAAERRFGAFMLPSEVSVGWWYGTPRFRPFFEATVTDAVFLP